jgi:hypothetical protein
MRKSCYVGGGEKAMGRDEDEIKDGEVVVVNGVPMFKASITIETSRPKSSWQQQRVISYLAEMYPNGVPAEVQRKQLLRDLGQRDPDLAQVDLKTLRRAIKTHNSRDV